MALFCELCNTECQVKKCIGSLTVEKTFCHHLLIPMARVYLQQLVTRGVPCLNMVSRNIMWATSVSPFCMHTSPNCTLHGTYSIADFHGGFSGKMALNMEAFMKDRK
ncbi:hypothetical protein FKM82_008476 [Ascaphus truei]